MQSYKGYYLQQMGYTVWQKRKAAVESISCQCLVASYDLDRATLLCYLDKCPTKPEKDLWVFLAMAFDFSQQYCVTPPASGSSADTICPACVDHWLDQSGYHHAIAFGSHVFDTKSKQRRNLLRVPGLADMLINPYLKKQCFMNIQQFLCQQPIVI